MTAPGAPVRHLLPHLRGLPAAGTIAVDPTPAQPWRPRLSLALAWTGVRLLPPRLGPWRDAAPLECRLVRAWDAAADVEWLLLTTVPVASPAGARRLVGWYACRRLCEDYHRALKAGCGFEKARLRRADRLEALLGFCALIAIRLLYSRERAKTAPGEPATQVASSLAIKLVAARRHLSVTDMTVAEFWRAVAGLGGFLGRRCDGPPGRLDLWRGWMIVCEWCWAVECAINFDDCG